MEKYVFLPQAPFKYSIIRDTGSGIPDIYHFRVVPAENVDALERQIAPRGFEWWSRELLGHSGRRD